jgi:hypothetical protein
LEKASETLADGRGYCRWKRKVRHFNAELDWQRVSIATQNGIMMISRIRNL